MGFALRAFVALLLLFAGWVGGSIFPAPEQLTSLVVRKSSAVAQFDWDKLKAELSPEQWALASREALARASQSGEAIVIERDGAPLDEHMDALAADAAAPPAASGFEQNLSLCPRMTVSNAPAADSAGKLQNFKPVVLVEGVRLAVNPTREACLSSGFGARNGRTHKGVDYHNETGGPILAGAEGVVVERKYRDDYGNMLLIDHGHGVYTRYAHLSSFGEGVVVGARVTAGQTLGLMGNTASYRIPVHLHYELLLGDYANPKASFGLTPQDPFAYPPAL